MARPSEVLGEIVARLRSKRREGASVAELVGWLRQDGLELDQINRHFAEAFRLSGRADLSMMERAPGGLTPAILDNYVGSMIDRNAHEWTTAPGYPDLMRRRDRHVFREAAGRTGNIFVVCAADPSSGQYIGKPGFGPFPLHPFAKARSGPPNQGLVAAAPDGPEEQSRIKLDQLGFSVSAPEDGHIIRDRAGNAFYPGYYLHGVYGKARSNAWTGSEGERIRAALNLGMGEELVLFGPHDCWDRRRGPRPPVLFFLPGGSVEVRSDARSMELYYRFLGIDWDSLYPAQAPVQEITQ